MEFVVDINNLLSFNDPDSDLVQHIQIPIKSFFYLIELLSQLINKKSQDQKYE